MSLGSHDRVDVSTSDYLPTPLPGPPGSTLAPDPYLHAIPSSGAISVDVRGPGGAIVAHGVPQPVPSAPSDFHRERTFMIDRELAPDPDAYVVVTHVEGVPDPAATALLEIAQLRPGAEPARAAFVAIDASAPGIVFRSRQPYRDLRPMFTEEALAGLRRNFVGRSLRLTMYRPVNCRSAKGHAGRVVVQAGDALRITTLARRPQDFTMIEDRFVDGPIVASVVLSHRTVSNFLVGFGANGHGISTSDTCSSGTMLLRDEADVTRLFRPVR